MTKTIQAYSPDILGDGFQQKTLLLADDYEGKATATLVRRMAEESSGTAILYVHGFNDYFFQAEMGKRFNEQAYNFYALELRKYGRSLMDHQKVHNVRSLREYDEEIGEALKIIRSEGNDHTILLGHSTGGLIVTNYAADHMNSDLFDGIICNSPFYQFNLGELELKTAVPLLSFLGGFFPDIKVASRFSKYYGHSIHKDEKGEWDYSVDWKPHGVAKISLGFIHAVHTAQKKVQEGVEIDVPALILHSDRLVPKKEWSELLFQGDAVLNPEHMKKYGSVIEGDVIIAEIKSGMHDLILSAKPVRDGVYQTMFDWLSDHVLRENRQRPIES